MRISYLATWILISFLLGSCQTEDPAITASKKITNDFFNEIMSLKDAQNWEKIAKIYPGIQKIFSPQPIDSFVVFEPNSVEETMIVKANIFYKGSNVANEGEPVSLMLSKDESGNYSIKDSKNLFKRKNLLYHQFAQKAKCFVDDKEFTDLEIMDISRKVQVFFRDKANKLEENLRPQLNLSNWKWDKNKRKGSGKLANNTNFDLPEVKYILEFLDAKGNSKGSDYGYISREALAKGEHVNFSIDSKNTVTYDDVILKFSFLSKKFESLVLDQVVKDGDCETFLKQ